MEDLFEMLDMDGGGTLTQDEFLEGAPAAFELVWSIPRMLHRVGIECCQYL